MALKRRMGIYGGTFDPVHIGHLTIARKLLELFAFDFVLFMPAYHAPHKRATVVTPALHRYAMLALATAADADLRISTVELDAPQRPYTVDTLNRLKESFGAAYDLFFIMGGDLWNEINTWHEWELVLDAANHVVVTRPGFELFTNHVPEGIRNRIVDLRNSSQQVVFDAPGSDAETRIYLTDVVQMNVSASSIREAISSDYEADALRLVPQSVAEYIRKYRLYTNEYRREFIDQGTGASS